MGCMYVYIYICEEVVERRKIMYLKWHLLLCLSLSHVPFEKMLWYPQHIMWCVTDGLYVCFHLHFWHVKTIICLLARNVLFLRCYCCTFIYLSLSAATAARTPSLTCFYAKSQDIAVICSFYYEEMSERNVSMYVARGMLMWHVTCNVCVCLSVRDSYVSFLLFFLFLNLLHLMVGGLNDNYQCSQHHLNP